jgi:hypothetical protein
MSYVVHDGPLKIEVSTLEEYLALRKAIAAEAASTPIPIVPVDVATPLPKAKTTNGTRMPNGSTDEFNKLLSKLDKPTAHAQIRFLVFLKSKGSKSVTLEEIQTALGRETSLQTSAVISGLSRNLKGMTLAQESLYIRNEDKSYKAGPVLLQNELPANIGKEGNSR